MTTPTNGHSNKNAWLEQLGSLYARLNQIGTAMQDVAASRMATTEAVMRLKAEQDRQDQAFLVHASKVGWLDGSNETARKLAKEKAYAERSEEEPFKLKARAAEIEQNEVNLRQLELKAHLLTAELQTVQTQVQIALTMVQADPTGEIQFPSLAYDPGSGKPIPLSTGL